ncbi:OpgC domain-containing protein [Haematospirillum jordaniae]|uniref:OpgC protein n=1 Tax=Haematospirillum jordaniae TaxID=1549855 RepID=A0A143DF85_9PROT|nr:OpgC domain-containing protein [Haematospirillum jordaniae]AMW35377.1 hypothetical protein AY555_09505 [Haematospirillum jordaniae]NKD45214.1 OpgC domain-containing protein [Haematospirillum jordaniae]NKD56200.1 OpgC domain-containing protein [Haematospirillum jordaniae]NKD58257.1 OpgC domain-containing protein [Haematospirillum jordaniae]NKD66571.1 OpgC domain-containing protein [Haematospirillum jordaniae]
MGLATPTLPATKLRDPRVDFFRGLALVFMFWDHLPDNPLGLITIRNFGLSDAAEIFVFLAGYSAATAWGNLLRQKGYWIAAKRILKRAITLYGAYLLLTGLLVANACALQLLPQLSAYQEEWSQLPIWLNDTQAWWGIITLQYCLPLLDPLPLYVILLLCMVITIPLLVYRPLVLGALSACLYASTLLFDLSVPGTAANPLFFNPLGWQFLFCLGSLCALYGDCFLPSSYSSRTRTMALLILGTGFLLAWSWKFPELHDAFVPQTLAAWLYPIDKSLPDPLRIFHFLALAWLSRAMIHSGPWLDHTYSVCLRKMGRHSLFVFGTGVIITPLLTITARTVGNSPVAHIVTGLAGTMLLALLTSATDRRAGIIPVNASRTGTKTA